MTKQTILKARQLAIGYGSKLVADGIDLELKAAQVLCLLGPNGSGKSTLFKTALGLIPALSGTIEVMNKPLNQWSRRDLARQIAYVPQQSSLMFAFTALEMVLMGRSAYIGLFASPSQSDRQIALQCLERMGVAHLAKRLLTEMSGGEQQLVLLARALAQEPKALVLDEPTASLDFGNQILVIEHIQQLKAQGLAVFLCTHQPEHAARMADEALLLADGKVFAHGPTDEVLTISNLASLYKLNDEQVSNYLKTKIAKPLDAFQ
ncbi:MAG: ABC transporter ATP-binding protein [Alcaligenaceae bacterium]|nr:ABC transporter ATP-binding protein [Alcaligenaceae bacterium]